MLSLVDTRGIYKNSLHFIGGEDTQLAAACGLRFGGDSSDLLIEQCIDEG
ncbi:hypothetical protein SDC9_80463 [bioreactor metagenome]|uniref:Uncharacterized protein n=1 Tax=bioreactor metagenome TaxID=1076179 RepID=A0A644YZI5_9ZZZZ